MAWLAAYHFNDLGSSTVVDVSGNGRDIDLTGTAGAQVSGGDPGGALGKTGATMPVLPASLLTAAQTDDRTIMLDVLGTGRSVWVIRFNDDALGSGIWGVLALDGVTMQSRARRQSDTAAAGALTFGTSQAATWHNLCLTYVRSTGVLSAYWDGTLVSSGVPSGWSPGQQLMVGADRIDLAEWTDAGPSIDNLRIADHAADATEVAALAGTPVAAPVPEATATVPVLIGLAGAATVPPATVQQASASLPLTVALSGAATVPTPSIPAAACSLPVLVGLAGAATTPPATVPQATGQLPLVVQLSGTASNGEQHDITLTASLAAQTRHTAGLGAKRWTATLGAQP